jgi:hypothetical protein
VETDIQRNSQLLKAQPWFDVPIVYNNGGRAILAIEKGEAGRQAFEQAFAQWRPPVKVLSYKQVSMMDLKVDKNDLKGRLVEVRGHLVLTGEIAALGSELLDANPVLVDYQKMSREQRRELMEKCASGCWLNLRGKIGTVMSQPGLIADAIAP